MIWKTAIALLCSINIAYAADISSYEFSSNKCVENVEKASNMALKLGEAYEKSGDTNKEPEGARDLDEMYHANYLDAISLYAAESESPDNHPKVIERNQIINQMIFEGINQGRSLVSNKSQELQLLNSLKEKLKADCNE